MPQIFPVAFQIIPYRRAKDLQRAKVHFRRGLPGIQGLIDNLCKAKGLPVLGVGRLHQVLGIHMVVVNALIEGVPVGDLSAVRKAHHKDGQTWLAEEHIPDQRCIRLDIALSRHFTVALPKAIPVDEKVPEGGIVTVFQNILKFLGQYGGVVQNEIQGQVDIQILQVLQILRRGQKMVQAVVDQGEAPVQIRVENAGKDIEGGKGPLKLRAAQHRDDVPQGAAYAVRVGVEHCAHGVVVCHLIPPFPPCTGHRSAAHRFWPE